VSDLRSNLFRYHLSFTGTPKTPNDWYF